MQTFREKQKNLLLRKFHTLLKLAQIDQEGKLVLLGSYGVESSKELNIYELTEVCDKLDRMVHPQAQLNDQWRKRVIAAIADYLKCMKQPHSIEMIKAVACRAAGTHQFNNIPLERLRSLYNAFRLKKQDLESVNQLTQTLESNQTFNP